MLENRQRKTFTADWQRGRQFGGMARPELPPAAPPPPGPPGGGEDVSALAEKIERLEAKLDEIRDRGGGSAKPAAAPEPSAADGDSEERIAELEAENRRLQDKLENERARADATRELLEALKPAGGGTSDRLELAERELQAIVKSTEEATQTILDMSEEVESMAETLAQAASHDPVIEEQSDQLRQVATQIYQAANFQDVTGQRVTKVVRTLDFVEQHVHDMKATWEIAPQERPQRRTDGDGGDSVTDGDTGLLNGPALEDEGMNQADIDALFD